MGTGLHREGGLNGEGKAWGKELLVEGTIQRKMTELGRDTTGEGTTRGGETKREEDWKMDKKREAYTQRRDMDGKRTYTKKKLLIIQKRTTQTKGYVEREYTDQEVVIWRKDYMER